MRRNGVNVPDRRYCIKAVDAAPSASWTSQVLQPVTTSIPIISLVKQNINIWIWLCTCPPHSPQKLSPRYCGLQCPPIGSRVRNFDKLRHSGPLYLRAVISYQSLESLSPLTPFASMTGRRRVINPLAHATNLELGWGLVSWWRTFRNARSFCFGPWFSSPGKSTTSHPQGFKWFYCFVSGNLNVQLLGKEPRSNISKQSWRHAGDSDVHHLPGSPEELGFDTRMVDMNLWVCLNMVDTCGYPKWQVQREQWW